MPLYDYACEAGHEFEHRCSIADKPDVMPCPVEGCGKPSKSFLGGVPALLTTIIPSYPGCKKQKAGYIHSHGDKAATKVSSGYGGAVNPKTSAENPIVNGVMPEAPKNPKPRLAG